MENENGINQNGAEKTAPHKKRTFKERLGTLFKRYLTTGIVVIIPLWLTYFVFSVLFKWVSNFTAPYLLPALSYFVSDKSWIQFIGKITCFFLSIASIAFLGFITNKVLGKTVLGFFERLIEKLPLLGAVYSAAKQFVNFVFGKDKKNSFKQVVFIRYPYKDVYSVGFVTGEQIINGEKRICVFMPTTPNPTTGFLMMYKQEDLIYAHYTIDQAFQFIVSVGVIGMGKNSLPSHAAKNEGNK